MRARSTLSTDCAVATMRSWKRLSKAVTRHDGFAAATLRSEISPLLLRSGFKFGLGT